jgi:AraC-like DNA-binding protein
MTEDYFYSLQGPLDTIPGEGQMRAANLAGFPDIVRNLGGNLRWILERHGIDPRAVSDADYHVDCKSLGGMFEYCSRHFDDSLFGLRLGQLQGPDVFGSVTALCRAAPSFREAVRSFIKYLPVVHSPVSILELVEGRETTELRFSGSYVVRDYEGCQVFYEAGLVILKLLRELGGRAFQPSYMGLADIARPRDIPEIEKAFGCLYRGTAEVNTIAFQTSILNRPIANSSRHLFNLLDGYLERVSWSIRNSIVERVEDYVRGSFQSGNCSVARCAQKLGLSSRTVQLHLSQFGVRFSEIMEKQRIELAKEYLGQRELSLDEVALLLGYAAQSSFGRAFRRATSVTPQSYRDRICS